MLYQLVNGHRGALVARVRERASIRLATAAAADELSLATSSFLSRLSDLLFLRHADPEQTDSEAELERRSQMSREAERHGRQLQRHGCTLAEVVHEYGEIGRCIAELAAETGIALDHDDFLVLASCVEAAVAGAIGERASGEARREFTLAPSGTPGAPMGWAGPPANHLGHRQAR